VQHLKLEDRVRDSNDEDREGTPLPNPNAVPSAPQTPGKTVREAVTEDSKCDYIMYTLRAGGGDGSVVAVLINTLSSSKDNRFLNFPTI